jgi:hypothetical protein
LTAIEAQKPCKTGTAMTGQKVEGLPRSGRSRTVAAVPRYQALGKLCSIRAGARDKDGAEFEQRTDPWNETANRAARVAKLASVGPRRVKNGRRRFSLSPLIDLQAALTPRLRLISKISSAKLSEKDHPMTAAYQHAENALTRSLSARGLIELRDALREGQSFSSSC